MGTNYFWRFNICEPCGRYDVAHVVKSGNTWQGYQHKPFNEEHPEWGFDPESPFGFPVVSVADWRRVFTEFPGELWDEYDRQVEVDPLEWLAQWPVPDEEQRRRKLEWWDNHNWWDPEGYHFLGCDFS